jgi:hypothetical protein
MEQEPFPKPTATIIRVDSDGTDVGFIEEEPEAAVSEQRRKASVALKRKAGAKGQIVSVGIAGELMTVCAGRPREREAGTLYLHNLIEIIEAQRGDHYGEITFGFRGAHHDTFPGGGSCR